MLNSLLLRFLNREAASPKSRAEEIMASLDIREGWAVADLGSGGGYFTFRFAAKVGKTGRVYAVDIRVKNLEFVKSQCRSRGLDNVIPVVARADGAVDLPLKGLDLIFVRNVFHHLPEPGRYFVGLTRFLKASGKVAIIEHRPTGGFSFVSLFKHHTPIGVIGQTMEEAGYSLEKSFDFLPAQTFSMFRAK